MITITFKLVIDNKLKLQIVLKNLKIQWKPLNRASVYRANRLFEQFRLKKNDPIFFLL